MHCNIRDQEGSNLVFAAYFNAASSSRLYLLTCPISAITLKTVYIWLLLCRTFSHKTPMSYLFITAVESKGSPWLCFSRFLTKRLFYTCLSKLHESIVQYEHWPAVHIYTELNSTIQVQTSLWVWIKYLVPVDLQTKEINDVRQCWQFIRMCPSCSTWNTTAHFPFGDLVDKQFPKDQLNHTYNPWNFFYNKDVLTLPRLPGITSITTILCLLQRLLAFSKKLYVVSALTQALNSFLALHSHHIWSNRLEATDFAVQAMNHREVQLHL